MALSPGFAGHAGLTLTEGPAGSIVRREGAAIWMARADEAWSADVTHVHLWLHAAQAAAHEFHSGGVGGFDDVVAKIDRARALGIAVAVSSLLTRSSARVLAELPGWLHARDVRAWRVAVPRVVGRVHPGTLGVAGVGALDGLVPRLGAALPYALQALAIAGRLGITAGIGGAPLCLLGPFAATAVPEDSRAYAGVCEGCPARPRCPGVDGGYLRRFGGDELSPQALRTGAGAGPPAWLFPGPGMLSQVETDMSVETARKVRLPVVSGGPDG